MAQMGNLQTVIASIDEHLPVDGHGIPRDRTAAEVLIVDGVDGHQKFMRCPFNCPHVIQYLVKRPWRAMALHVITANQHPLLTDEELAVYASKPHAHAEGQYVIRRHVERYVKACVLEPQNVVNRRNALNDHLSANHVPPPVPDPADEPHLPPHQAQDEDEEDNDEDNNEARSIVQTGQALVVDYLQRPGQVYLPAIRINKVEKLLKDSKWIRDSVTDRLDEAFAITARSPGLDRYTGWTYDEYMDFLDTPAPTVEGVHDQYAIARDHIAFKLYPSNYRRLLEVDHVWEIQLITIAIRETLRFNVQLTLFDLQYIIEVVNDIGNLNGTTWNLNLYKGKIMKDFAGNFQLTNQATVTSFENVMITNKRYILMFNRMPQIPPHFQVNDDQVIPQGEFVRRSLSKAMENVLSNHFYPHFFGRFENTDGNNINDDNLSSDSLKLMFGIMCSMFLAMFPLGVPPANA
jgi:hypothetical protein